MTGGADTIEAYKAAREFLLAQRGDYATAYRDFRWPQMDHFNWALDWFDAELARGPLAHKPALKIVGDGAASLTFAELSERSNRVANGLRALGVKRGDRMLLMLGNVAPLWEVMLAAMKLGAVVIPATTLLTLTPVDLADRFERGRARHVVAAAAEAAKFEGFDKSLTRIAVGDAPAGWHAYASLLDHPPEFAPDGPTGADDPMLLYFTSGTTAKPKLVLHSHRSYPVGHLTTVFVLGLRPGDVHLNISSPGWAKHAWSCFFAPWIAGATIFIANQPRFNARYLLDVVVENQVTTLCAPPTVWRMLIQEDLKSCRTSLREVLAAGEPLNPEVIEQVEKAWGLTIRDFLRPDRNHHPGRQSAGPADQAWIDGAPPARLPDSPARCRRQGRRGRRDLHRPRAPPRGTDAGLPAGRRLDRAAHRRRLSHRRRRLARFRRLPHLCRPSGRRVQGSDYRISPFELESILIEHPAVAEAAVVPAPDAMRLAVPKAYITLTASGKPDRATALSIFQHLRGRLAPFKRIRRLEFAELPKTISGKIRRVELRRDEEKRAAENQRGAGEFREEDFPELAK